MKYNIRDRVQFIQPKGKNWKGELWEKDLNKIGVIVDIQRGSYALYIKNSDNNGRQTSNGIPLTWWVTDSMLRRVVNEQLLFDFMYEYEK